MKRTYILIALVITLSIAIVITLFLLQDKPVKNGFVRINPINAAGIQRTLDLKYNTYYINDVTADRVFLGNIKAPRLLLSCNRDLRDVVKEMIPFSKNEAIDWDRARMRVDSQAVYLTEYTTPYFVSAERPFRNERSHNLTGLYFDMVKVLSPNCLIVNGYNPVLRQKALQKISTVGGIDGEKVYKHELQQNSNFSIDGFMNYNKQRNRIIFTYYYRNTFICLDTNMNIIFKGKTIDTNTVAKIKTAEYEKDGKTIRTMASPTLKVNNAGYSDDRFIYIQSALFADNEKQEDFNAHTVIDGYSINTGMYVYSFFIPKYKGIKLTDFAVRENMLVALHGRYLVTYQLPFHRSDL